MTNKGAKRNVPHLLQAQQAPICLWLISETLQCQKFQGIVTKSTVSSRVCWTLKVLWGSVSADLRQFQVGGEAIVLWPQYREKMVQYMLRAIAVLHFPICARKRCSRGGSLFLPYRIQPNLLSPLITVRLKMTYIEIFQSNKVKYTTNRYVDCNAVSWFSICS